MGAGARKLQFIAETPPIQTEREIMRQKARELIEKQRDRRR